MIVCLLLFEETTTEKKRNKFILGGVDTSVSSLARVKCKLLEDLSNLIR